jgi:regulator-associated protein of mTOR
LVLLSRFLDLGPWAVNLALSIGIFPYVVKLLQSAAQELKPVMVFIWARIMAVDYTVQSDLLKDNGIHYFISILNPNTGIPVVNASEHRAMCAFIVAIFCKNYHQGQTVCLSPDLIDGCLKNLTDPENPLLRQWSCLCLSMLWLDFSDAKWVAIRCGAHLRLCDLSLDPVPEVRASMIHALTTFLAIPDLTDQVAQIEEGIASSLLFMTSDGSTIVRKELLVFFSTFVKRYENKFTVSAYEQLLEERDLLSRHTQDSNGIDSRRSTNLHSLSHDSVFGSMWKQSLILSIDPHPEIARNASVIVDYVHEALTQSPMGSLAQSVIDDILRLSRRAASRKAPAPEPVEPVPEDPKAPPPQLPKDTSYLSLGSLKRTAASLRNLAFGGSTTQEPPHTKTTPQVPLQKPKDPPKPLNTPRGRLPPEWSRPPETNDPSTPLGAYHQAVVPTSPGFNPDDMKGRPSLPLISTLLDWSTEVISIPFPEIQARCLEELNRPWMLTKPQYFREPQMKPNEPDEPGSSEYNQRLWRRTRNERIIAENQPLKEKAGNSRWDRVEQFLNNQSQPMKLTFHQFEDHLAVADDKDNIW